MDDVWYWCSFCDVGEIQSAQLWFIYAWNQVKLNKQAFAKIRLFHKFRFILDFKFYLAGFFAVLTAMGIIAIYTLTQRSTYADALGPGVLAAVRCEWWHIPGV